jgi:hypothetical protein
MIRKNARRRQADISHPNDAYRLEIHHHTLPLLIKRQAQKSARILPRFGRGERISAGGETGLEDQR